MVRVRLRDIGTTRIMTKSSIFRRGCSQALKGKLELMIFRLAFDPIRCAGSVLVRFCALRAYLVRVLYVL